MVKEAQSQAIQASKLATLGEMATSVAHELNQPLNVIRLAAENLARKLRDVETVDVEHTRQKIERIIAQTERAAAIIDHMRMFGRKSDSEYQLIDPKDILYATMDLVGQQLKLSEIDVRHNCDSAGVLVLGDVVILEQVFLNLINNARDALHKCEQKIIWISTVTVGKTVQVSVADNAGGVPKELLSRVFEPFFTTKQMGDGTGLGLSISYGIVADLGGELSVENTSVGACFTVTLPIGDASEQ